MKLTASTVDCTMPNGIIPNVILVTVRGERPDHDGIIRPYGDQARIAIERINGTVTATAIHELLSSERAINVLQSVFQAAFKEVIENEGETSVQAMA